MALIRFRTMQTKPNCSLNKYEFCQLWSFSIKDQLFPCLGLELSKHYISDLGTKKTVVSQKKIACSLFVKFV